jgi:hypothetical protein
MDRIERLIRNRIAENEMNIFLYHSHIIYFRFIAEVHHETKTGLVNFNYVKPVSGNCAAIVAVASPMLLPISMMRLVRSGKIPIDQ